MKILSKWWHFLFSEKHFFCRIMVRTEAIWYETLFDSARTLLLALSVGHMTGTFCFPANQYCRSWFHYKSIKILMAKLFSHLYHLLLNNYFDNTKGYAWELLKNFVMKRIKSCGKGKKIWIFDMKFMNSQVRRIWLQWQPYWSPWQLGCGVWAGYSTARLLHSLGVVAVGLSMGYETWHPIG